MNINKMLAEQRTERDQLAEAIPSSNGSPSVAASGAVLSRHRCKNKPKDA
jgi:hypothetical protein